MSRNYKPLCKLRVPFSFTLKDRGTSISAQSWQLRVRSAAILAETVNGDYRLESVANARLRALDTMVSNLLQALRGLHLCTSNTITKDLDSRFQNMILTSKLMLHG